MHWSTKIGAIIMVLLLDSPLLSAGESVGLDSEKKPTAAIASIRDRCHSILKEAMASEEAFVRSGAMRAAGDSKDPELIPLLEKGSRDFYPTTRLFAVQGIQKISKDHTKAIARKLIEDSNMWVRSAALDILSELGDGDSREAIRSMLKAPDRMVRLAAAFALYRLGELEYLEEIIDSLRGGDVVNRYQAISYLGKIGTEKTLGHLVRLLDEKEDEIVSYSLKAIGARADIELLRPLERLSRHANPRVRQQAVLEMGYLPPQAAIEKLKPFCGDQDPMVKLSAAIAIHRAGGEDCQNVFAESIHHSDFGVRSSSARILGGIAIAQRPQLLATALRDPNSRVRTAAVRATGMMGGAVAFQLLIPMLEDSQLVIRAYAAGSLLKLLK